MGFRGNARYVEKKIFGTGGAKRRYGIGKGKGGFKLAKLAADLEMIKERLNVEKKHREVDVITSNVGQVNANADGILAVDVTPSISQGTGEGARVGNSIKLTGMTFPMSFTQQINCMGDRRVRVSLLRVRSGDNGVTTTEAIQQVWQTNPLTGVRDFNAPRAYRSSKQDGISIIRSKVFYVKGPDVAAPGNNIDAERNVATIRLNLKLDEILRYAEDGHSSPDGLRYYLVFQCNAGNVSSVASTTDVPVTDGSTGLVLRLAQRYWYVDN